jgi:predicted ATPase
MSNGERPKLDAVIEHLTRYVSERGPALGAALELELRTKFPDLTLQEHGYRTLNGLLLSQAPLLSALDRVNGDLLWGTQAEDDLPGVEIDGPRQPVRLIQARFEGYRSMEKVTVDVSPLTLLVGANGTGKSNLLDGLFRVVRLERFHAEGVFHGSHGAERVLTRGHKGAIFASFLGGKNKLQWGWNGQHSLHVNLGYTFGPARLLTLNAREIAKPAYSDRQNPYVTSRGHQIPAVLSSLAATDPDRFAAIQAAVRQILPRIEALRMPRVPVRQEVIEVHYLGGQPLERPGHREVIGNALEARIAGQWIPGDQLSEGTLVVIALQTILGVADRPRLLLLDDLDRGLHPAAQRRLIRQLIEATASSDLTVVASTHSPFVLDEVPAESVRVVRLDKEGHTQVEPLTASPKWEEWKGSMTAGEFWIFAGEDWLESA